MIKFRLQISVLVFFLHLLPATAQKTYSLQVNGVDTVTEIIIQKTGLQTSFDSRAICETYINNLPNLLQSKGYVTASVDSIHYGNSSAAVFLFLGKQYKWALLDAHPIPHRVLDAIAWRDELFKNKLMNFEQLTQWENRLLDYYENNGYPFAKVFLDSVQLMEEKISALLKVEKGPLYKVDSIRIYGNANISNDFLQRFLDIPNGSTYSKAKLLRISQKIAELPYVEEEKPADLTRLATGSIINLYLKQKKSSRINFLIGFLPNSNQLSSKKLLITGEGNLNLVNALGAGETIGLNFQALQVASQRLNFIYQHPYFFKTPIGLDFGFHIFKKDSSFVNINFNLGAQYVLNHQHSGKLFIQRFQTFLSQGSINDTYIIQNRQLPEAGDVSATSVGIDYQFDNTDYRLNPKKGNRLNVITTVGTKKVKKNNEILALKDPSDPAYNFDRLYDTVKLNTYQFRLQAEAAKFFPLGKQSTIMAAVHGGFFQSGNIFRNELFQIGGYKLLRGFDEESQYLSRYAIATVEYRLLYLSGQNSYFYVLADGGWGSDASKQPPLNYTYFGTGIGLAFETKAGIFNLAWAIGKRNDTELNLRQSKIHFGFVNYF